MNVIYQLHSYKSASSIAITNEEESYEKGYRHYESGDYEKALAIFFSLAKLKPYSFSYTFALASTLYMNGDYKDSLHLFEYALILEPYNLQASFCAAECCLHLGKQTRAIDFFSQIVKAPEKVKKYFKYSCDKAEAILQSIQNKN